MDLNVIPVGVNVTPTTKPGYKTTEFWLKVAAMVLTLLFASGGIPTTGPIATVTAIAATMLGALGYTVGRSMVKSATSGSPIPGQLLDTTKPSA